MIQFGVMANTHPGPGTDLQKMADEVIAEAQQAERCGFDSFFLTEHHQEPNGYFASPLPMAAAVAARTSRIRIGTGIVILPLYHPSPVNSPRWRRNKLYLERFLKQRSHPPPARGAR